MGFVEFFPLLTYQTSQTSHTLFNLRLLLVIFFFYFGGIFMEAIVSLALDGYGHTRRYAPCCISISSYPMRARGIIVKSSG